MFAMRKCLRAAMVYTFRVTGQVDDTRARLHALLAETVNAEVAAAASNTSSNDDAGDNNKPRTVPPYTRSAFSFAAVDADPARRAEAAVAPSVAVTAATSQEVLGYCVGYSAWSELYVDLLAANAHRRVPGTGTALLHAVEQLARERGCDRLALFTMAWQARPFYEKHGFRLFAQQDNYAGDQARYCLEKHVQPLSTVVSPTSAKPPSSPPPPPSASSSSPSPASAMSSPLVYGTPTTRSPTMPVPLRIVASNYAESYAKAVEWIVADTERKPEVVLPPIDEATVAVEATRSTTGSSNNNDSGGGGGDGGAGEKEMVGGCVYKTMWGNYNVDVFAVRHDVPHDEVAGAMLDYLETTARQRNGVRLCISTISSRLAQLCSSRGFREYGRQDGVPPGFTLLHLDKLLTTSSAQPPQPPQA